MKWELVLAHVAMTALLAGCAQPPADVGLRPSSNAPTEAGPTESEAVPTESTRARTPAPAPPTAPGPTTPGPEATSPSTREGARELGQDEDARMGQAYLYRLYTHCGIIATWWNGAWWDAAPPLVEGGSPPQGWNDPFQDGVMVQVSEHQLEFTGDEGQEAAFVPRPPEHGAPPPCD